MRHPTRPRIVCLCGSTRFWNAFVHYSFQETIDGNIVLSIGAAPGTDDDHLGRMRPEAYAEIKEALDTLHLRKIDLADEILVLNIGGYIGESTRREIAYAESEGKVIRYVEAIGGDV